MNKLIDGYCRLLEWILVASLAVMVVLVFGNVVLRYAFNSGITVSEEVSRWLFVWLTFLGAIVAHEGARPPGHRHAGLAPASSRQESLPGRRPGADAVRQLAAVPGRVATGAASIGTCRRRSPVRRWRSSMAPAWCSPSRPRHCCCATSGGVLSGRITDAELVMVKESEEAGELEALQAELARGQPGGQRGAGHDSRDLSRRAAGRHGARHSDRLRVACHRRRADVHLDMFDAQILAQNLIAGADSFPLLAVPFFMLAGEIMNVGGLSQRIVNCRAWRWSATSRADWATSPSSPPACCRHFPARPSPMRPR